MTANNYFRFEHAAWPFDDRGETGTAAAHAAACAFAVETLLLDGIAPRQEGLRGKTPLEERVAVWREPPTRGPWSRHAIIGEPVKERIEAQDRVDEGPLDAIEAALMTLRAGARRGPAVEDPKRALAMAERLRKLAQSSLDAVEKGES